MTIAHPNPQSRFPAAVAPLLPEGQEFVFIDIGARGVEWPYLAPLRSLTDVIGFEPEAEECARLNAQGRSRSRIYPTAIAGRNGSHNFYTTQFSFSSGLYRGNQRWLRRFPFTTLNVVSESKVDAVTLDRFAEEAALTHVDFIKIDVEGAECDVIEGAATMLPQQHVLGLFTEFWWDPVVKGQRGFAEIDLAMREKRFRFFDLVLHRYSRSTLPAGHIASQRNFAGGTQIGLNPDYGQSFTGDALYFRDPVGEHLDGALDQRWDRHSLLRLCGLLDVFDYGDCAIEILDTFRDTLLSGVDVDPLIDALTPPIAGTVIAYDRYLESSIRLRQDFNARAYGLSDWVPPPSGYRRR